MKKHTAIDVVNAFPKEFDLEDLFERLLFIEKVEKGLDQAKNGKTVSHEAVVKEFRKKWQN